MPALNASQRWTMVAAILGSSMVFLDGTVMNLALPKIGEELPATILSTLEGQTYAVSGYLAVLAALLVLAGALADYHGRRKVFAIGLVGFGVTSVMCGLAPTLELLVLARLLQGAAGALLVPGSLAILTALFEGPARARAFGIWASATSATTLLGPVIGGLLVDGVSWRAAFLINVPLVAIALWATLRHMPETRAEHATGRFDWLGAAVAVLAVGGLAFGAIRGQDRNWTDSLAWASLAVGTVALVAFPLLMARRANPLVPLALFRRRRFGTINLSTLLIYGALYTVLYVQSLFLQGVIGYTATAAGVIGLPLGILLTVLSARVGTLAGRFGSRGFLVAGPLIMAAGLLWLARVPADTEPWLLALGDAATYAPPVSVLMDILPFVLLFGFGLSLVVAPLTSTLMSSVPVANAGLASAINNSISRIGQPLLSAVIFVLVSGSFYAALAGAVPGLDPADPTLRAQVQPLNPPAAGTPAEIADAALVASVDALRLAALVCAALLVAGAAANGVGLQRRPGEDEDEDEDEDERRVLGTRGAGVSRRRARRPVAERDVPDAAPEGRPHDWDGVTYDRVADPMTRWGTDVLGRLHLDGDETVLDAGCGSGRVTELLAERLPGGRIIALDASPSMVEAARERLARFGDRVRYIVADLAEPLPLDAASVDAILSTAALHWARNHDTLFGHLAEPLRPGGMLVAQCGGSGNIAKVQAVLATIGDGWTGPWTFATPEETRIRLEAAGFEGVETWLTDEPTPLEPGEPFLEYLRTVVLGAHLDRLPAAERAGFVRAVADALPEPAMDYVRLNILARRAR